MLGVEGHLENAYLPMDTKHPLLLPTRHPLTRLITFHEHAKAEHAGLCYSLRTWQRISIVYGISSVKRYFTECVKCAVRKVTPIR